MVDLLTYPKKIIANYKVYFALYFLVVIMIEGATSYTASTHDFNSKVGDALLGVKFASLHFAGIFALLFMLSKIIIKQAKDAGFNIGYLNVLYAALKTLVHLSITAGLCVIMMMLSMSPEAFVKIAVARVHDNIYELAAFSLLGLMSAFIVISTSSIVFSRHCVNAALIKKHGGNKKAAKKSKGYINSYLNSLGAFKEMLLNPVKSCFWIVIYFIIIIISKILQVDGLDYSLVLVINGLASTIIISHVFYMHHIYQGMTVSSTEGE